MTNNGLSIASVGDKSIFDMNGKRHQLTIDSSNHVNCLLIRLCYV